MRRLRSWSGCAAKERFISPFFFAVAAIGAGDVDGALAALADAVRLRAVRLSDLHLDHRFAPLRDDSRFAQILGRIGMDPEAGQGGPGTQAGLPDR